MKAFSRFSSALDVNRARQLKLCSLLSARENELLLEQLPKPGSKILVGMSGGVDSSVSAAILHELGCYDLVGCWMKNWDIDEESPSKVAVCSQEKDWRDAKNVAEILGIPFFQVDLSKDYWCSVWEPSLRQYQQGYTPNPDILCNRFVKFGSFYHVMKQIGADTVATGHYARIHPITKMLMRGLDTQKDQSYFLSGVLPHAFESACFPVGSMPKSKVKMLAKTAGFNDVVAKPESQGVCFIGERGNKFSSFLEEYLDNPTGDFIDAETGKVIGKHNGVLSYTIGQRAKVSGKSQPYFVARKVKNDIWIAPGASHEALKAESAKVVFDNAVCGSASFKSLVGKEIQCQVRYRGRATECAVTKLEPLSDENSYVHVRFNRGENSVAEGQTLALYDGELCYGGGAIVQVNRPFFKRLK